MFNMPLIIMHIVLVHVWSQISNNCGQITFSTVTADCHPVKWQRITEKDLPTELIRI